MPRHDNPPKRNNVVITDGALNLIDEDYLKEQSEKLMRSAQFVAQSSQLYIGLLIGGDTKNFRLNKDTMSEVVKQVKSVSEKLNAHILVTTSRRTPREIEELIKMEFKDYPGCKVLIIANEDNPPFTVGGILGMSQIIVVTPESISMISEAVSSQRYIVVFDSSEVAKKHRGFLDNFASNKYIYLTKYDAIAHTIEGLWSSKPKVHVTQDNILCKRAISRIL